MANILQGMRILDLTQFYSGTMCTQLLGGMGAEVIRVEPPIKGSAERSSPPFVGPKGVSNTRQTPEDLSVSALKRNRCKKSITLNLKSEKGREMFLEMAKKADVIMENFRPGTVAKLGISYEDVCKVNPNIIYCSLNGFQGITAYEKLPAFDIVVQAFSGIMSTNGETDGDPTRTGGVPISDAAGGVFCCIGILSAYIYRQRTGIGQYVYANMMDGSLALLLDEPLDYNVKYRGAPMRCGSRMARLTPFNVFHAQDGDYVIACSGNAHWAKLLEVMGRDDLIGDERYSESAGRYERTYEVDDIINDWSGKLPCAEVISLIQGAGIPCAKIRDIFEVSHDENLLKAGSIMPTTHPTVGPVEDMISYNNPIHFSKDDVSFNQPCAMLGQHNETIYRELLGLDEKALDALREQGIV